MSHEGNSQTGHRMTSLHFTTRSFPYLPLHTVETDAAGPKNLLLSQSFIRVVSTVLVLCLTVVGPFLSVSVCLYMKDWRWRTCYLSLCSAAELYVHCWMSSNAFLCYLSYWLSGRTQMNDRFLPLSFPFCTVLSYELLLIGGGGT